MTNIMESAAAHSSDSFPRLSVSPSLNTSPSLNPMIRQAKHRLQAILRQNKRVRIYNCHRICGLRCLTDIIKMPFETVEVEYYTPQRTADVAVVSGAERKPLRVRFEIRERGNQSSEKTKLPEPSEPWFQVSATEILDSTRLHNGTLHLNELRDSIPASRDCSAHTFQQKVWLAGYHLGSLNGNDTLEQIIEEQWKINLMAGSDEDPMFPEIYRDKLRQNNDITKAEKIQLYADYYPDELERSSWCKESKRWAEIWTNNFRAVKKAREDVKASRKCIGCCCSLYATDTWKILCTKCWQKRMDAL